MQQMVQQPSSGRVPRAFAPPYGGGAYFGQAYRWEQILHYKYWIFVGIQAWIKQIAGASFPNIGKIKKKDASSKKAIKKALGGPRDHQEFEPYDDEHPLVRLFHNPNAPDVSYDLWAYHILFKKLTGSAHWWVIKNGFGVPVEIWVIPTHWMRLHTDRDGMPMGYTVQPPWASIQWVPYEDVVSFYEHSPLNRYEGHAVTQAIAEWIDVYESTMRTWLATFKNGAAPAFHVELDESYGDPDEAFLSRLYAKWFQRFQGEDRSNLPFITGPGMKVTPFGIKPTEVGYETSEARIRDNTLCALTVPKVIVGLQDSMTYGALVAALNSFFTLAINPELLYTGQICSEKIIKPCDPEGAMFWDEQKIIDPSDMREDLRMQVEKGIRSPNDARTVLGIPPYPNGGNNPLIAGVEMPWAEDAEADKDLETAMREQLGEAPESDEEAVPPGEEGAEVSPSSAPTAPSVNPAADALRATVGAAGQILEMQKAVHNNELSVEMARSTAVIVYGYTDQDAERLFPLPREQTIQRADPDQFSKPNGRLSLTSNGVH
jgi:hypothetical protein